MIRSLPILLGCFLTIKSFGQIGEKVNAVLAERDFKAFNRLADGKKLILQYTRDLVEGYQESVFYIHKSWRGCIELFQDPKIGIITQGNLIICYSFLSNNWLNDDPPDSLIFTTYSFVDTARFAGLKAHFQKCFLAPLNENELFIDTIWYGARCNWNRELTPQQMQIKNWVMKKDTTSLFKWLQSTNTEKQIYAIQGFHSLNFMGMKISEDAKRLISLIQKKKGNINACSLNDHISYRFEVKRVENIAGVVKAFNFL